MQVTIQYSVILMGVKMRISDEKMWHLISTQNINCGYKIDPRPVIKAVPMSAEDFCL